MFIPAKSPTSLGNIEGMTSTARIPACDDAELDRMVYRLKLLAYRGMPEEDAQRLVDELLTRDRQHDRVHVCIECRHWARAETCKRTQLRMPDGIFHRCHAFNWQTPNPTPLLQEATK